MSNKRFFFQFSLLIVLVSTMIALNCVHFSVHIPAGDSHIAQADTTAFSICQVNSRLSLTEHQPVFVDLNDFVSFANAYCNSPLLYENIQETDTTGDGIPERVESRVYFTGLGCTIKNSIVNKAGDVLWKDEMTIDDLQAARLFGGWENYDELYPFSSFYLAVANAPFVDALDARSSNFDFRKKFFLNKMVNSNKPKDLQTAHTSELASYMDTYRGKYIFSLNMAGRDIYMWDAFKKAFVPIYLS